MESKNKRLISIQGILIRKYDEHINRSFLLQNLGGAGSLIVESDIGADVLHELNLLFRTSGPDNLETLGFRYLDDKSNSRVRYMSFSHQRRKDDLRPDRTSACGNKDSLALMEWMIVRVVDIRRRGHSPSSLGNTLSTP